MQTLDPYSIPLESINLIEASAGTGKSWTVTLLYLRLILTGLTVDQILVVTFTDAATKELRDDIRNRLIQALAAFQTPSYAEEDEYQRLIKQTEDLEQAIHRLNRAKLSLDEAAIFTIHGFCQRSLNENAFAASLPFDSELMEDDSELMQKLTDDFWRRRFSQAPRSLMFKLHQKSITPDSLLKDICRYVGKTYLKICGPQSEEITAEKWLMLEQFYLQAIQIWRNQGQQISDLLRLPEYQKHYYKGLIDNTNFIITEMEKLSLFDSLPYQLDVKRMAWLGTTAKVKKTAKVEPVEHRFFQKWQSFLDLWDELDASSNDFLNHIRIELLHHLQIELPKEKQRLGVLSFDDLLLQMQQALKVQPQLANQLQHKYAVALIDEFQDTDPIQYAIFSAIYNNKTDNAVFFVGDPKQAIYSFRGGDIHTYLQAKMNTDEQNHYTLKTNWRSHPKLVSAFNTLYQISENPLFDEAIEYIEVKAGNSITDDLITPSLSSPLRFWNYKPLDEKPTAKQIRSEIAAAVAGDITALLNAAVEGKAKIGETAVSGGDIAILIRSHAQANIIKAALNDRGIPSVQSSKDSIYDTHEANEMRRLLIAIVEPHKEDEIRRALVTELMGYKATDLIRFQADSEAWEDVLINMQNWHYQWNKQGFLPMLRGLMKTENMHQRLLAYPDGERRLTNILQLSELIHQATKQKILSMAEVIRWLKKQQEQSASKETELRLESDENLVKIVTIHKSKGLEYPIVYCPFVGMSGKAFSDKIYTFHQNEKACLEIGSAESEEHKTIKKSEESAEDARLLYVALTRAKYQCTVVCFNQAIGGSPDRSALGWLLSNGKTIPSGTSKAAMQEKAEYFETYNQNLQTLSSETNGNISLDALPEYSATLKYNHSEDDQKLTAKTFTAEIKKQAHITSFSGLTAGAHDEAPDYDSQADTKQNQQALSADEFPRGAIAGTALHEIYENLDFTKRIAAQIDVFDTVLDKYNFDVKHKAAAVQLIEESLQADLKEGLSLNQLANSQRLNEMEFYLPLERLQIDNLKQILFQYLPKYTSNNANWQLIRDALETLYFEDVEGYLKGFIDLIFEHDGKYYLADYKSNSLTDYAPENLFASMADSHYYLQYLIYSVALHRYLQQRIPDYNWETHIGGVYYLFIRGMQASHAAELSVSENKTTSSLKKGGGVFYDKPSLELIEALDGLFVNLSVEVAANV